MKPLKIEFSLLAESISKQLTDQGFHFNKEQVNKFQEYYNAMMILNVNSFFSKLEWGNLRMKLFHKIEKHVAKFNV